MQQIVSNQQEQKNRGDYKAERRIMEKIVIKETQSSGKKEQMRKFEKSIKKY